MIERRDEQPGDVDAVRDVNRLAFELYNLRTDPFERADITSNTYFNWMFDNGILALSAAQIATEFLKTFKDFPPRQKAATFTIDQAMEKMESVASGALH